MLGAIVKLTAGRGGSQSIPVLVASPLIVCAEGCNGENTNPHLRLKVHTRSGDWNKFTLPKAALVSGGNWQAELLRQGVRIGDPDTLLTLLKTVCAPKTFKLFERAGWNGEAYVLPNGEVIGPDADVETAFRALNGFEAIGEKDLADAGIFKLCENNSRLTLAVCAALAAPFLKDTKVEAGGFHFHGLSGSGKTTTVRVGASVWGSGADAVDGGTVGSWRATDNGVEADAALHSDGLFTRTELKECKPSTTQQVIYMLGNGMGKQAMTRNREAREILTFRPMVLSDGELSTREHIESDPNLSYDAGAGARLHDIPADAGKGFGAFEDLHGAASPKEFAEALKLAVSEHYGHHGRALVQHFIEHRDDTLAYVQANMTEVYDLSLGVRVSAVLIKKAASSIASRYARQSAS